MNKAPSLAALFGGDIEARIARAQKRHAQEYAWTQAHCIGHDAILARRPADAPARLNITSLPAWLAVAVGAGVHSIPARALPTLPAEDYRAIFDAPTPEMEARMGAWVQAVIAALGPTDILRFEQKAPYDLKSDLSSGKPSRGLSTDHKGHTTFDIWGEGFYDTFRALHTDTVRPYARPYVAPVLLDGGPYARPYMAPVLLDGVWADYDGQEHAGAWPVEFRVFVRGLRVVGVSAYYPQRPLDDTWLEPARQAAAQAQRMLDWMHAHHLGVGNGQLCADTGPDAGEARAEWIPEHWGPQDCTLDFLWPADGSGPVFLEAGPGGWRQAAPCCFESDTPGTLEGVKLALNGPIHPLHP